MHRATMIVRREGVGVEPEPRFDVPTLQFEQGQMPGQMAEQSAIPDIQRQPFAHECDAAIMFAGFVTQMGEGVRAVCVARVRRQRAFDRGRAASCLPISDSAMP